MRVASLIRWCVLFVVVSMQSHVALAQREQLGIRFESIGSAGFKNPLPTLSGSPNVSANSVIFNAAFRSLLDAEGSTVLTSGVQYRYTNVSMTGVNGFTSKDLHMAFADLLLMRGLNDNWALFAAVRPGVFSDFQNGSTGFRIEGAVFVDNFISETTTLGFGLSRTSLFGRDLIIPVVHLIYVPSASVLIDCLLPGRADFWYYPSKTWELGVNFSFGGTLYETGQRAGGTFASADRFAFAQLTGGPVVRYNLLDKTYLSLEAGMTLTRRAELTNSSIVSGTRLLGVETPAPVQAFNPQNAVFVRAGMQIMFYHYLATSLEENKRVIAMITLFLFACLTRRKVILPYAMSTKKHHDKL